MKSISIQLGFFEFELIGSFIESKKNPKGDGYFLTVNVVQQGQKSIMSGLYTFFILKMKGEFVKNQMVRMNGSVYKQNQDVRFFVENIELAK